MDGQAMTASPGNPTGVGGGDFSSVKLINKNTVGGENV
jgi:hypothetical protein